MFELVHTSKRFRGNNALDDMSLCLPPGRTTVLIGPSGCGKSTVLRLCTGLIAPDGGEVQFDGKPLTTQLLPDVRRKLGYVIQDGGLFPHLSAWKNVAIMARHLGWTAARIERRVAELRDLVRLPGDALNRVPGELSGGQRQRVSLMRALMLDPEVLLLDEPLGALDPMIRFDLQRDLIGIFRRLAKTVLLVTHDLREAEFFADKIVLMRDGKIVQAGGMDDLVKNPADPFVERFLRAQRGPLEPAGSAS